MNHFPIHVRPDATIIDQIANIALGGAGHVLERVLAEPVAPEVAELVDPGQRRRRQSERRFRVAADERHVRARPRLVARIGAPDVLRRGRRPHLLDDLRQLLGALIKIFFPVIFTGFIHRGSRGLMKQVTVPIF